MKITRRRATDADKAFARDAHHQGYRDVATRQFGPWDESLQDAFFEEAWGAAEHDILLCDGVVCGYVSTDEFPEYNHVRELVVLQNYQGRGIATAFCGK